jgi:protein involved in polysaccharide export with SLBB domain
MGNVMIFRVVLLLFLAILLSQGSYAQSTTVNEEAIRAMLAERGIPEDTLRERLIRKGFDPDNIRPEQIPAFESAVKTTITEYELEQKAKNAVQPPGTPPETDAISQVVPAPETPPTTTQPAPAPSNTGAPIYGQEIFRNNSIPVYQQTQNINAPDSYILDEGDQIGVLGFGRSQFEEVLAIGASGFVKPKDRLPQILLKGVRWGEAKEILYQRFSQYYVINRSEFIATLVKPRNLTVNVFGEARTTGAITLPGINTAFNVISAAGGPTDIGSVRRIKVIRGGKSIPLDVYAFMNNPAVADNYYLQNNDYIHIPVAEKVVTIHGAVVRPMSYELLDEENLIQLIRYAGGALPKAYLSNVQITRFLDTRQVVTNVNLKELMEQGGDYILIRGDVIEIKGIEEAADNFVTIAGSVLFEGKYENRPGTRVTDLVNQAVLKPDARLDYAILLRYNPDDTYRYQRIDLRSILDNPSSPENVVLNNQDRVQIVTVKTYADAGFFFVTGAVKKPNRFPVTPEGDVKLEDALLLAGGTTVDAADYGYIIRHDPSEPKTIEYIDINVRKALEEPRSDANIGLRSGDVVQVFNKSSQRDAFSVAVYGSVRSPGTFEYAPGMTLADLVNLAGGFTFDADNERIDIARVKIEGSDAQRVTLLTATLPDLEYQVEDDSPVLQPFDHIYVRALPEFEFQQIVSVEGEVKYPGNYSLLQDKERIHDIIVRAGGLTGQAFPAGAKLYRADDSVGLVVIDLEQILDNQSSPSNIVLLAGDRIIIPKNKDLVSIEGFVNLDDAYSKPFLVNARGIAVAFRGAKSAKYYVDEFAAGVSKQGDADEIKVQYADGRVEKTTKFLFFNNYPRAERGSTITVGPKEVKPQIPREQRNTDWSTTLRDTMAQATAVLTLLILVDQLSK